MSSEPGFTPMSTISRTGIAALLVSHCAGMLDLVALPVWVGAALIGSFKFDPQQAGLLASLFLMGQVFISLLLAPRFGRIPTRLAAVLGFAVAALSFLGVSQTDSYALMALLHFTGGLGAGCALSVTHGTIGLTANPHRLFAFAGFAIALFGVFILGGGTKLVTTLGGSALFVLFAGLMLIASVVAIVAFPRLVIGGDQDRRTLPKLPSPVWFGMLGMGLMTLAQAMTFSFVERIGIDRSYGTTFVTWVLIAVGVVNLIPGPLAGFLQNQLRPENVVLAGPLIYAACVHAITQSESIAIYATIVPILIGLIVFTHTFLFGLLARLDPTGRAVAATPAMIMIGAALGPLLGGTTVKLAGYQALGLAVAGICLISALCFLGVRVRKEAAVAQC